MTKTKNDFSNWLVASDIDGTLNDKSRKLPKRNYDAVQNFVHDLGGNFTLASGRCPDSMRGQLKKLDIPVSIVVAINGGCIYDFSKEEMLWKCPMNDMDKDIIKRAMKKNKFVSLQIITEKCVYVVRPTLSALIYAKESTMKINICKSVDDIPDVEWFKAIFSGAPNFVKSLANFVKKMSITEKNLMFTSPFSFEMVSQKTNKGVAVLELAKLLGVDKENTAAIGDYFNDYEMLKSVALPACCGQAPQGMKDISKLVTCHCNNGAVADLLEYIIKNYNN